MPHSARDTVSSACGYLVPIIRGFICLERGASAYRLSAKPENVFGAYWERFLDERGVLRTLPVRRDV